MAMAHKFSASQVAVFPKVFKSQETIEPMIPGRAAAALPAKLARARNSFKLPFPHRQSAQHKSRDCHPNIRGDGLNSDQLFPKEGANALSECCILMEDSSQCLADSVNLGLLCLLRGLRALTVFLYLCMRAFAQDS